MTMHNLELTEEQAMIQDTVRKLVQDVVEPQALEHDEHARFVKPSLDAVAEMGLFGAAVAEEHGGAGLGYVSLVVALEELGRGCGSTGRMFLVAGGIAAKALEGIDAAADTFGAMLAGESVVAFVGPEHGIAARADGDGFILEGTAPVVTGAGAADVLVVAARLGDAPALFVVEPAVAAIEAVHALGYRATAPAQVAFSSARIGADACVARDGVAAEALARADLAAKIGGAALAVGSALASVEHGRRHTEERIAFGKPLARQQAVGRKLVECLRRAEGGRQLAYQAARLADSGQDATETAAWARLTAVDAALLAADESIQVHGGYGYTVEYHVERHYRDAKALDVLDGGASAMRDAMVARLAARA